MVIHTCESCNYSTNKIWTYNSHLKSKKHNELQISTQEYSQTCEYCTKKYKTNSGLWRHKQTCTKKPPTLENVLLERIAQLENKVLENQTINNNTVNNITNNITNNIININLNYLNTHCGNALNIGQFVESIVFTKDDYNEIAKNRCIAQGATNVLNKKLENLSVEKYPIHCSAVEINKPTIFFVRDKDRWNPESQSDIEYQQNTYEEDVETNVEKLGMMRFLEEFDGKLYDEYMELSKKDPNLKRIADKMFICGQSQTHIKMLREIPDKIESLVLDPLNATNTDTDQNLLAT
jgi:hypothetical protein